MNETIQTLLSKLIPSKVDHTFWLYQPRKEWLGLTAMQLCKRGKEDVVIAYLKDLLNPESNIFKG